MGQRVDIKALEMYIDAMSPTDMHTATVVLINSLPPAEIAIALKALTQLAVAGQIRVPMDRADVLPEGKVQTILIAMHQQAGR